MTQFNFKLVVLGLGVLAIAMWGAPSATLAQCPYSGGYGGYVTSSYYAPSYGYGGGYYAPSYGYNQRSYYGGGNPRLRRALTVAAVAGIVVAASNSNSSNRNRSRSRSSYRH